MRSLGDEGVVTLLVDRLGRIGPDTSGRWGRMSSHQMVCHLADSYRFALGRRQGEAPWIPIPAPLVRFVALRLPLPWPRGAPTLPSMDQSRGGTPPGDFGEDREELVRLLEEFSRTDGGWPRHPLMGRMSRSQWGIWAYRHTDHHLRQFGA